MAGIFFKSRIYLKKNNNKSVAEIRQRSVVIHHSSTMKQNSCPKTTTPPSSPRRVTLVKTTEHWQENRPKTSFTVRHMTDESRLASSPLAAG